MSRVLVVEDDKDIAELIAHYLQKAGHTVETAASGTAGLTRAKDAPPDLIKHAQRRAGMQARWGTDHL